MVAIACQIDIASSFFTCEHLTYLGRRERYSDRNAVSGQSGPDRSQADSIMNMSGFDFRIGQVRELRKSRQFASLGRKMRPRRCAIQDERPLNRDESRI
jgi:hypothetical protein